MNRISIMLTVVYVLVFNPISINAYWVAVHESITDEAIKSSNNLTKSLNEIGLPKGSQEVINGKPIKDWIKEGSKKEDDMFPIIRFLNHFYNPLTSSGLSDFPFYGRSSYEWASALDNDWSWRKARDNFYRGLILTSFCCGKIL